MAVKSILLESAMVIKYKTGVDKNGKDVIKSGRFNKIKLNSTDEDLFAVGEALGTLIKYPVLQVTRENESHLINE